MANRPRTHNPLRATRLKRLMSQQQLADAAKVNVRTIKYAEGGRTPTDLVLHKLAVALGVEPEDLLPTVIGQDAA